jgi:hypothetical protein
MAPPASLPGSPEIAPNGTRIQTRDGKFEGGAVLDGDAKAPAPQELRLYPEQIVSISSGFEDQLLPQGSGQEEYGSPGAVRSRPEEVHEDLGRVPPGQVYPDREALAPKELEAETQSRRGLRGEEPLLLVGKGNGERIGQGIPSCPYPVPPDRCGIQPCLAQLEGVGLMGRGIPEVLPDDLPTPTSAKEENQEERSRDGRERS